MKILFIVLSGGKGTRLRPLTFFRQKTLLPATRGRRIIDYALETSLVRNVPGLDVKTIVLAKYKSRQVARYVQEKYPGTLVLVESESLDTGGAMLQHWRVIREYVPEVVIVLNGDHLIRLPLQQLLQRYQEKRPALMMIGVQSDETHHDYINTRFDSDQVLHKFPWRESRVAYTGISLLRFDALQEYMDRMPICNCNMTKDIIERIYARYGGDYFLLENEWNDLGTWKRYLKFIYSELIVGG